MTIEELNSLPAVAAEEEFLKCCGSMRWARRMSDARPFASVEELLSKADEIWRQLSAEHWLEAFRAHPQIGERKAEATQSHQAATWSAQEQSQAQHAADEVKAAIATGNRAYGHRFGFIFIICASGKSADQILASLNGRLPNDPETEIRIAAEEQRKITQLRLNKLLTP
jgi:OHCU decarboxylase